MKNKHVGQYFVELAGPELTVYRFGDVVLAGTVVDGAIVEVTYGDDIPAGVEDAVEELYAAELQKELEEISAEAKRLAAEDAKYAARRAEKDAQFVREDFLVL